MKRQELVGLVDYLPQVRVLDDYKDKNKNVVVISDWEGFQMVIFLVNDNDDIIACAYCDEDWFSKPIEDFKWEKVDLKGDENDG